MGKKSFINLSKIKSKKITKAIEANDRERATELQEKGNPFEELIQIVENTLPNAIKLAEESANSGQAKKLIAMSQLMLDCAKHGLDFSDFESLLSKLVDDFVAMSKEVNVVSNDNMLESFLDRLIPNEEGKENG